MSRWGLHPVYGPGEDRNPGGHVDPDEDPAQPYPVCGSDESRERSGRPSGGRTRYPGCGYRILVKRLRKGFTPKIRSAVLAGI